MKEAKKRAEARGLKVTFFTGDNLVIKDKGGKWISARAYINRKHVFVRADHALYTADQLVRHELGHDMIAKGEIDIDAVRKRLEKTVGKENIDEVAKSYDDALNYYQVEDVFSKAEFDTIYREIKQYGRSGQIKSVQGSTDFIDKLYKSSGFTKTRKSSSNSNETQHGAKNSGVQRVGENSSEGREQSSSNGSRDSQSSSEDRQKYSRELDTEYLSAVNRGDMETAQKMVDEAAKKAGDTERVFHGTRSGEFYVFDENRIGDNYGGYNAEDRIQG